MNLQDKLSHFIENNIDKGPQHINSKVLIIDGLNTFIRCFAARNDLSDDGLHIGGIVGFLQSIGAAIRFIKPTRVIVAWDGKGGSQRRRALFSDYKANRKTNIKLNRAYDFNTLEDEEQSKKWQLLKIVEILQNLPVLLLYPENIEADDVIAYLANYVAEDKNGKAIIMSSDKDFLQLVTEYISVYSPIKHKLYNINSVLTDYKFHPNNFLLYRAITGDNSDNIPGIMGVKEKTLLKFFPELSEEKIISIDDLLDRTKVLNEQKSYKALENILICREQLELNTKLMDLRNVSIGGQVKLSLLDSCDNYSPKINKYELTKILLHDKLMPAFGKNYDEWVNSSFNYLTQYKQ